RAHVEQWAMKLGLSHQVRFLGFIPREQVLKLYAESTAMVYPSTFGPENLPPLEAFAIGCPVAAARIPGAAEQLGDAALLFDPHDHEAMADAIYAVIHDTELRRKLVERGRARATRWSTEHFADGLLAWFDRFAVVRELWP
ncbi:MAG TPA: glycosyltransferase, partial [Polyangiales bacterium]